MLRSNSSLPRAGRIPQICAVGHCYVSALPASSHSRRHRDRVKGRSLSLPHAMKATTGRLSLQQRRHVNVPFKHHRLAKISPAPLARAADCPRSCRMCPYSCLPAVACAWRHWAVAGGLQATETPPLLCAQPHGSRAR
jgi:hypothetical protein